MNSDSGTRDGTSVHYECMHESVGHALKGRRQTTNITYNVHVLHVAIL